MYTWSACYFFISVNIPSDCTFTPLLSGPAVPSLLRGAHTAIGGGNLTNINPCPLMFIAICVYGYNSLVQRWVQTKQPKHQCSGNRQPHGSCNRIPITHVAGVCAESIAERHYHRCSYRCASWNALWWLHTAVDPRYTQGSWSCSECYTTCPELLVKTTAKKTKIWGRSENECAWVEAMDRWREGEKGREARQGMTTHGNLATILIW